MKVFSLLCLLPVTARGRVLTAKVTPVTKVVTLLKDMSTQLEKEGEEDDSVHEKMTCWCESNAAAKAKSIEDGEQMISDLRTTIETTAASSSRLTSEIAHGKEDLAKSQQSLATATSLREQQAADFHGEEKDMIQSISALDSAIVVLSRHAGKKAAFLDGSGALAEALEVARTQMQKHMPLMKGVISPHQRRMVLAQQKDAPSGYGQTYAPQSSEIFGILKQMKETFETNLAESQKEETEASQAYEALKNAKEDEIAATQGAIDEKANQLAESDEKNAQAKEDLEDMSSMLVNDNGFLMTVKEKCELSATEYESRQKLRMSEMSAVTQAISILSNDDAYDQFQKSFNPAASLLQVQRSVGRGSLKGAKLAAALRKEAVTTHNDRLAALADLAETGKLDAFTKVKEAIDQMVTELLAEKQEEIAHRDNCITELNQNELLNERELRDRSSHESKVEGLKIDITDLSAAIDTLNADITEANTQIKRAGEDRELANKDYQTIVADHREAQVLLQKAVTVLKAVYASTVTTAAPAAMELLGFVQIKQIKQPDYAEPPAEFKTYEKSGASGGVVALIEQILAETVTMEKEVTKDEQSSQADYEAIVKETNLSIQSKQASIIDKTAARGKAEQDLGVAEEDVRTSITELEQLSNTAGALHMSCDFVMKNFEVRQEARDQEVEALRQAKAILSGMQV